MNTRRHFLTFASALAALPIVGPTITKARETDPKQHRDLAKAADINPRQPNLHVIVGATESGKTTVVHALAEAWVRLDPKNNVILVNDKNRPLNLGPNITMVDGRKPWRGRNKIDANTITLIDLSEHSLRSVLNGSPIPLHTEAKRWEFLMQWFESIAISTPVIVTRQLTPGYSISYEDVCKVQSTTLLVKFPKTVDNALFAHSTPWPAPDAAEPIRNLIRGVLPLDLAQWHANHREV